MDEMRKVMQTKYRLRPRLRAMRKGCGVYQKPKIMKCPGTVPGICKGLQVWARQWKNWGCAVDDELNLHAHAIAALQKAVKRLEGKVYCGEPYKNGTLYKCDGTLHSTMLEGGGPGGPGEPPDEPFE